MSTKFVHLHVHSHYSLLDGLAKIDHIVDETKKRGVHAVALTDHGGMYGIIEFYKKCTAAEIKPILGVEVYVALDSRHDKRPNIDNKRYHLVLLAKNLTGYKNLMELVTLSNLEGYYYKPRVDKEILKKYSEGIIALSACMGGEVPRLIRNKQIENAEKSVREYQEIFGKEDFYLEIQHHPNIEGHEEIMEEIVKLARKTDTPLVATQDSHYIKPTDATAQDFMIAIQNNDDVHNPNRLTMKDEDYSMRTEKDMVKLFKKTPDAIENTIKIAEKCNVTLKLDDWVFPIFDVPGGKTTEDYLTQLATDAYEKRFKATDTDGEAKKRLDYELSVITTKGYAPYFLVVSDMINYARRENIFTNTRGSAAGSFVSYLIGITNVDPLKYKLPFERFLNPERPSPPDIDMDIADIKRDTIIDYLKEKYGEEKVAQIGTFGTMAARGSVKDVTRASGEPYSLGDRLSKLIPMGSQGFPMTIKTALGMTPELKEAYKNEPKVKEIFDIAQQIEGCVRHVSMHAAGVVIAPTKLSDFVPVQYEPKGEKIITQYDMYSIEPAGLIKFDILGLKNLSILQNAKRLVKKIRNIDIDLDNVPLDDPKTFKLLVAGETMGVFQLSSSGMTKWLKELKPESIWDVMAMIALYRPGPMAFIPEYIKRKNNPSLVTYLDPQLEDILKPTYGIIIYQDDILLIAVNIAGYTWTEADKFRKAVGKKIPAEMAKQKKKFMDGCIDVGGMAPDKVKELWDMIETFAAYGFNKGHSASYGKVAYQTAYLKANYPIEYMTAILTADAGDTDKIAVAIGECKRMKIPVLPPNINESFKDFAVAGNSIRFGLYTIKNFGEEIANIVIDERKKNGPFKSFSNFLTRIQHRNMNKKSLEALIKTGAMDIFGERGKLLANMEKALTYNKEISKQTNENQQSLFGTTKETSSISDLRLEDARPATQQEKLIWEKELLGLYISGHPLDRFAAKFEKIKTRIKDAKELSDKTTVVTIGMIEEVKQIMTKKNDPMAFVKLSDYNNSIEMVAFPRILAAHKDSLFEGNCVAIKGKMSHRNGDISILIDEIKTLQPEISEPEKGNT